MEEEEECKKPRVTNFPAEFAQALAGISRVALDEQLAHQVTYPDFKLVDGAPNPYFEREREEGELERPRPEEFSYLRFRSDVDRLIGRLEAFSDNADPAQFDQIAERLVAAGEILDLARGQEKGIITTTLKDWTGGTAIQFYNAVIDPFDRVIAGQMNLARVLTQAAIAYREVIELSRTDVVNLANAAREKIESPFGGGQLGLEGVLAIVGAVAAGVATGGASWAGKIAWIAATSNLVLGGVSAHAQAAGAQCGQVQIEGHWAGEFLPAAEELADRVLDQIRREEQFIQAGLYDDIRELRDKGLREIEFRKPDLTENDRFDDLGEVLNANITRLKRIGVAELPQLAEMLDRARLNVGAVRFLFDSALGSAAVVGTLRHPFDVLVDVLESAIIKARDYIYDSGVTLSRIADEYYNGDEEGRRRMNEELSKELDLWGGDTYTPLPPPPQYGDHQLIPHSRQP